MSTITILSIDPSSTYLGWCISEYNIKKEKLIVIETGTFGAKKIAIKRDDVLIFGEQVLVQYELEKFISNLVTIYQPDYICSEDAFFNSLCPSAYASLLLCINTIRRSLFDLASDNLLKDTCRNLNTYAPKLIKKCASLVGGSAQKEDMLKGVLKRKDILFDSKDKLKDLKDNALKKEHEIDSICVAYTFIFLKYLHPELWEEYNSTKHKKKNKKIK